MAENAVVGTLRALLTLDSAQFESGVRKSSDSFKTLSRTTSSAADTLKSSFKGITGAFAAVDFAGALTKAVSATSKIADASQRMGIGAEAVQRLAFAAEQGGSSLDAVATSMTRMADVLGGSGGAKALQAVGLSFEQIKGLTPDQTFTTIADAIAKIPDPLQQSDAATTLFGRSAATLLPAIKAGFTEVGQAAPVMSAAVVQSGDEAGDKLHAMQVSMENMKARALVPMMQAFMGLPDSVQTGAAGLIAFMPSLQTVSLGILSLGGPSGALATLTSAAATFGTFFSTTLPGLVAGGLAFFTTTLPAAFGTVIAFLGPQGLIALALLGLGLIWWKWGDDITAAVTAVYTNVKAWLSDKLKPVFEAVGRFFAPVMAAYTTAKDTIVGLVTAVYTGVKTWLVDKFTAIVGAIKDKIDAVTGFFRSMKDAVVGHSYVPDMVRGVEDWFGRLDGVMVRPARAATAFVEDAFRTMQSAVTGLVQNMLSKISGMLTGWLDDFMPAWAAQLVGGLSTSMMNAGAQALMGAAGIGGGGGGVAGMLGLGGSVASAGTAAGGSSVAASVAGVAAHGGAAGTAGTVGAGIGLGTTLAVTGGIAGAALLTYAIWKKGLFRGGAEALQVNPRRDQFLAQFGPGGNDPASGFGQLAATLTALTGEPGGGSLFSALKSADKLDTFRAAENRIRDLLAANGQRVQVFHAGGMVQGSGTVPALLQGGERVLTRDEAQAYNRGGGNIAVTIENVYTADAAAFMRDLPTLVRQNRNGLRSDLRGALGVA